LAANENYLRLLGNTNSAFFSLQFISSIYEKFRWGRCGRAITILGRVFFKPFSYLSIRWTINDNELTIVMPETYTFMGFKFLGCIEYAIEHGFEYLILTNSSSYINLPKLRRLLLGLNKQTPFYGGKSLPHISPAGASGSFVVLNIKSMQLVLKNRKKWNHAYLDDVALMRLMHRLDIKFTDLSSIDIKSSDAVHEISLNTITEYPHIKCGPSFVSGVRIDHTIMNQIHQRLLNAASPQHPQ